MSIGQRQIGPTSNAAEHRCLGVIHTETLNAWTFKSARLDQQKGDRNQLHREQVVGVYDITMCKIITRRRSGCPWVSIDNMVGRKGAS